ncbi:protein of unknown function (DUF2020) [Streptoalloteichus tenebrarius]|uniref:DUF2020 domain-containing protein n=1 Tax=Streptoalloteichus tenebrarius (strain ATCC 17920 / DSM 40477 / JCM 4838 / CBS 697.72 / NBRC 16177 / NCIMB 11028 / NRRL B-12390 / A12253. 1 / ISP 5477) TaxID=1933 RepID=A0ABT1I302_STRSD|nr:DUF2020 domain-containing protein [Streptoalloteichus tenebrarius]MCP2262134.1 protein of unknown function (DUF2020) [Streptoalloteichus tenebrarius]BFF01958.1 DUF2020 domain-containing protein [Streptoalloteichus tenebrarius]
MARPAIRVLLPAAALAATALLGACDSGTPAAGGSPSAGAASSAAGTTTTAAPPASVEPVKDGDCPYLDRAWVAEANGQKVSRVRLSADQPNPACFFYGLDGKEQLRARVFVGDARAARTLVDQAAPIDSSSKAELAGGWKGGSMPTQDGSVFAVAKEGKAVVVHSNQTTTFKAKRVAERTIQTLGL